MISFNLALAVITFYIMCATAAYDYGILIDVIYGGILGATFGIGMIYIGMIHSQKALVILTSVGAAVGAAVGAYISATRA